MDLRCTLCPSHWLERGHKQTDRERQRETEKEEERHMKREVDWGEGRERRGRGEEGIETVWRDEIPIKYHVMAGCGIFLFGFLHRKSSHGLPE